MPQRRVWLITIQFLATVTLLAWLIVLGRREEYWADEGYTLRRVEAAWTQIYDPFSNRAPTADPFDTRYVYDFNPPLYFALIRSVAGPHPSPLGVRLFSILPVILSVGLIVWWANRRLSTVAGTAIAIACMLSPALIYYGHEARPYALAMMFSTLMVLAYERRSSRVIPIFILNLALAFVGCMTHYHVVWIVLALAGINLFDAMSVQGSRRKSLAALAGLIGGIALTVAAMLPVRYSFAATTSQASPALSAMALLKLAFFPVASQGFTSQTQVLLMSIAAALFCILAARMALRSGQGARAMALWLIPTFAPIFAHTIFGQLFHERYVLFALPAWMMLFGLIVHEAAGGPRAVRLATIALALVLLANGINWSVTHLNRPFRPPWRPAIEALFAAEQPGDFYTVQPNWITMGFVANAPHPPKSTFIPALTPPPAGARRIWVIEQMSRSTPAAMQLTGSGWRVQPVSQNGVYWLWRAEK